MNQIIQYICDAKEIFSPDPDDPEQMIMVIPPELLKSAGLQEGDELKVSIGDKGTIILEKV